MRANGIDITVEQYVALVNEQDGHCALCDREMQPACLDHNHETKQPRGLLCTTCNTGLGKFGDDPERLRLAAVYLERYAAPQHG